LSYLGAVDEHRVMTGAIAVDDPLDHIFGA
jgi:hypothetical protein